MSINSVFAELDFGAWLTSVRWPLTIVYLSLIGLIGIYGLHRYRLVYLFNRYHKHITRPANKFTSLPKVTVQLPMFNEGSVAQRVIDAACKLDYPVDKLQIQVLDDSTDNSKMICADSVNYWRAKGINISLRHRNDRHGYKAGALQEALADATGELIAIFDADFIPPTNFLKRTVHYFTDEKLGMVQARWTHLNRNQSMLTRAQAIFLDGHFVVEHTARNRSGAWINFNGTAGLWRTDAIVDAGGWQHDTLTEDVDLSYRAQLKGWHFLFLPHLACPAELPPEINAFKSQQHRWTKGSIQTAKKLLLTLCKSSAPFKVKLEAFFHLSSPMVYLYITLFALLFYPALYVNLKPMDDGTWLGSILGISLLLLGTVSAAVFYVVSQRAQKRNVWLTIMQIPILMAVAIGIALNNTIACLEAIFGLDSPFIRTPKYGTKESQGERAIVDKDAGNSDSLKEASSRSIFSVFTIFRLKIWVTFLEIGFGLLMLLCAFLSLTLENTAVGLPFLLLFASGYLYVGISSLALHLRTFVNKTHQGLASTGQAETECD